MRIWQIVDAPPGTPGPGPGPSPSQPATTGAVEMGGGVRVRLAAALVLAGCLQIAILLSAQGRHDGGGVTPPVAVVEGGRDADHDGPPAVLAETVRLLFMGDASAASAYLRGMNATGPGDVAYHVRELPAGVQTAEGVSSCMEGWGHSKEVAGRALGGNASMERFLETHCGWSSGELSGAG